MLAANWDRLPWDETKIETWVGLMLEVRADGSPIYSLREAQWATKFLLRKHTYPSLQFSDFDAAVMEHRKRVAQQRAALKELRESEEFRRLKGGKRVSIASLLTLAAPRKMPDAS